MQAQYLYIPCLLAAFAVHNMDLMGRSRSKDPVAILKTASYMVEAVAILPQLYLQHAPGPARGGWVGDSRVVGWGFACSIHRGLVAEGEIGREMETL